MRYFKVIAILYLVVSSVSGHAPSSSWRNVTKTSVGPSLEAPPTSYQKDSKGPVSKEDISSLAQQILMTHIDSFVVQKFSSPGVDEADPMTFKVNLPVEEEMMAELGDDNVFLCHCPTGPSRAEVKKEIKKYTSEFEKQNKTLLVELLIFFIVVLGLYSIYNLTKYLFFTDKFNFTKTEAEKFVFVFDQANA